MTTLGTYPSRRYARSWVTQRIYNRAPLWSEIRKNPVSVGAQWINPTMLYLQETIQMLTQERFNMFASTVDLNELVELHYLQLPDEIEFTYTEDASGEPTYVPPNVYATIRGTEYQITQAENNDIETLGYDNIVSRIEDGETQYTSTTDVIAKTLASNLSSITPNPMPFPSHLYITISGNDVWEVQTTDKIHYSKCFLTGVTRKGTTVTEVIPLRYNGTFKTVNEWESIDDIKLAHIGTSTYVSIQIFPWDSDGQLDTQNIVVPYEGGERPLFIDIGTRNWGSTLLGKGFTVSNFDIIRSGVEEKEVYHEIELLDENDSNININDFVLRPNSRFMYAIDNSNFYVYDTSLEFPDTRDLLEQSPETKVSLYSLRWIWTRGETAYVSTKNDHVLDIPARTRWHLLDPDGNEYYVALDGTLYPTTVDSWDLNTRWEDGVWIEQEIPITFLKNGVHIVTFEAQYYDDQFRVASTYKTKMLLFIPSIKPEIQLPLPTAMQNAQKIGMDSDLKVWVKKSNAVRMLDVFHDYFLVDYEKKVIWCKENYTSIRVTV
jgi:hypothetical protein